MLRKMCAMVMFYNPVDLYGGRKELIKHGFTVEHLEDWVDPVDGGRSVWVNVEILSELDSDSFFDWGGHSRARWRRTM